MNFIVTTEYSRQAKEELFAIQELTSHIRSSYTHRLTRSIENISSCVSKLGTELVNCCQEIALSIHKFVAWLWLADSHSQRECMKQSWNGFITSPVKLLLLPLYIVHEPLFRLIALKVDKNSYVTKMKGTFELSSAESAIVDDFSKEHYLVFDGSERSIQEIHRYVLSLKQDPVLSLDEYKKFYETRLGIGVRTIDELRSRYLQAPNEFVTNVKQLLAEEHLRNRGIPVADSKVLAKRALAGATQEAWRSFKKAIEPIDLKMSLTQNSLHVTADRRVFVELRFVNFAPESGAWTVRDIIRRDMEHHEGVAQIELTCPGPAKVELTLGDGSTGSSPLQMHGGTYVAGNNVSFIAAAGILPNF